MLMVVGALNSTVKRYCFMFRTSVVFFCRQSMTNSMWELSSFRKRERTTSWGEFANIGQIPKFEKLIATIRSREISASIILQSQSQLKAIYKDNADTITGNCDTTLFLGGKEKTTLKEMSELLGKETIDSFNTSETRGRELSHGLNYQKLGKELMTQDEIAVMDGGKCILQVRGVRPFFSDKFDITKHPKYKYLSDADPKNAFDMEKHIKRRPAIVKPDEEFDYYEIDGEGLQEDTDHE